MDIKYTFNNGVLNILECSTEFFDQSCYRFIDKNISIDKNINIQNDVKEIIFPDNIEVISAKLFSNHENLKKVKLPSSLKWICKGCFEYCKSLEEISIPEGVTEILDNTFHGCINLRNVTLPSTLEIIRVSAFEECIFLKKIEIPEGVKKIEADAFWKCYGLKEVILPSTITEIGRSCFKECAHLEEIYIPEGVTKLGPYIFQYCVNLKKVILPSTIDFIGESSFENCESLEEIKLPESVKKIDSKAFSNCKNLKITTLPLGIENLGEMCFSRCDSIEEIAIPEGVKAIPGSTFDFCDNLKKVTVPSTLQYIGGGAFSSCESLEEIEIPEGVDIDGGAFLFCYNLKKIKLPSTLKEIKEACFNNCESLDEIEIPECIEKINERAFGNCRKLKKVTLPTTLKNIEWDCFNGCESLEEIDIPGDCQIGETAFYRSKIGVLKVNEGPLQAHNSSFNCAEVNKLIYKSDNKEIEVDVSNKMLNSTRKFGLVTQNKDYQHNNRIGYCYRGEYKEFNVKEMDDLANEVNKIYNMLTGVDGYILVNVWKSKNKFMPHYTVIQNMPVEDIDLFYKNKNCNKWGELVKVSSIEADSNKGTLFKLCYALGVFQESGSKRDEAIDFIIEHILSKMDEYQIHAKFDGLDTFNHKYDPMWADFFMKYFKENHDFMFYKKYGYGNVIDLLAASYNNFYKVKEIYPNKLVNTNREADVLLPSHVISAIQSKEYYYVDMDNKEFALKVGLYGYTQEQFEELQEWFNQGKNIEEKDLKIFISEDISDENNITYELLAKDNPFGAVLGNITNCCQVLGGAGESCVEYGMTMPNSKFMTFNYKKEILGQAWVWYDEKTGVVCLDNVEVPTRYIDKIKHSKELQKSFVECLKRMASNFISEMESNGLGVNKVTIGEGYNDIKEILNNAFYKEFNNKRLSGYKGYSDADNQYVIKKK